MNAGVTMFNCVRVAGMLLEFSLQAAACTLKRELQRWVAGAGPKGSPGGAPTCAACTGASAAPPAPATQALVVAAAIVCASLFVSPSSAAEPALGGISPYGFRRGAEIEATLSGARLADAEQLLFYSPGIEVTALTKVNDSSFKAKLKVAPDCRLGNHAFRVRTAT